MDKLKEMELLSKQAAERVKSILYDTHSPFKEIELLQINKKDKSYQEYALALTVYYSLHYGHNLKKLSTLVAVENPIAGLILNGVGRVLEKISKHYHLRQTWIV
jgi:hypothetical protein